MTGEQLCSLIKDVEEFLEICDVKATKKWFSNEECNKKLHRQAKQYLISHGYAPNYVEAMPVKQVIVAYSFERYQYWQDEMLKLSGLPYYEAYERMGNVEQKFGRDARRDVAEGAPFNELVASFGKVYFYVANISRQIAVLRIIEAIRIYAADHDSKLPGRLGDITQVPIPIDPITGTNFKYKVTGDTAVIDTSAPKGMPADKGTRYQIRITK